MGRLLFILLLWNFVNCEDGRSDLFKSASRRRSMDSFKQQMPTCPLGETCTIDQNCQAPDGTSYCAKDVLIKECPDGQAVCTLYDGTTGCSICCDGIPDCIDQSDEIPCNKYKCDATWRLVYQNDKNGRTVFGMKTELTEAVRQGAEVKVLHGDIVNVATAGKTIIVADEVCFQHIFHISKGSWTTFQSKLYWWFSLICTTGDRSMSRLYVGSHSSATDSQDTTGIKWFVRHIPGKPVLTIPTTGYNLRALSWAVKTSGYGVTIKQKLIQQNEEYHTTDNIEISADATALGSQVVWDLLTESHKTVIKVSTSGNWAFTHFSSDGFVEFSKYWVGENTRVGIDSAYPSQSEWIFDPCWEQIYATKADGGSTDGSVQRLIDAVLAGNRVKVLVNNRISQASVIRLNGGIVTALLPNMLRKSNISTLEDPVNAGAKWEWSLVNTRGKVETATYLVGDPSGSVSRSTADIKWFVDRRKWKTVLDVGQSGSVNSGSKTQLADEVKNGADVRYAWVSTNAEYTIMEADNIGFDGKTTNFAAMHVRSLLLTSDGYEYMFAISSGTPTWLFTLTTNSGTVNSIKWEVGNHVSRGERTTQSRVVWWTAY